ncbi:Valine--tRNA ligase [Nymphaea thermarum]|nr:Valine--tRNA ligase [Nymphaea thermarum]
MAASIFGRALRCQSTTLFLARTLSSAAAGSATTPIRATLFPGDGIGPEIVESVKQVSSSLSYSVRVFVSLAFQNPRKFEEELFILSLGLGLFEACKKLWADLEEAGLAVKKESSTSRVPRSERGGEVMCDELLMSAKHAMNPKQQDVINKFMHTKDALSPLQQKGKLSRETWELLKDLDEAMSPPSS